MKQIKSGDKSILLFELLGNSLLAGFILSFFYYLHYYHPIAYVFLISEDHCLECATFSLFFVSSLILFRAFIKHSEFRKLGHFAFALLSFFIAMEEISWGQRIFHFSTPEVIKSLNFQGEMSFHNITKSKQYMPYIGQTLILGSMVLPVLTKLFVWLRNFCSRWGIPIVSVRHWPYFALTVYLFDYYYEFLQISMNKELGEFSLGLAVFVVARDLVLKPEQKAYGNSSILSPIKMTAIITTITIPLVVFFPDNHHIRHRMNQFSSIQYPEFGLYQQAALVFDYIERHPKYHEKGTLYYHGLVLLKLGRKEESRKKLNNALEEIEKLPLEEKDNSEVFRDTGKIYHVLGNISDAKKAYLKALELDRKLLSEASDPESEANARWSMGKTLFTMGKKEAAYDQFQRASDVTQFNDQRNRISRWAKKKEKRVALLLPQDMAIIDADLPHISDK